MLGLQNVPPRDRYFHPSQVQNLGNCQSSRLHRPYTEASCRGKIAKYNNNTPTDTLPRVTTTLQEPCRLFYSFRALYEVYLFDSILLFDVLLEHSYVVLFEESPLIWQIFTMEIGMRN